MSVHKKWKENKVQCEGYPRPKHMLMGEEEEEDSYKLFLRILCRREGPYTYILRC
jgi:hypothetical protein